MEEQVVEFGVENDADHPIDNDQGSAPEATEAAPNMLLVFRDTSCRRFIGSPQQTESRPTRRASPTARPGVDIIEERPAARVLHIPETGVRRTESPPR